MPRYLGIELGATNIKSIVLDVGDEPTITHRQSDSTLTEVHPEGSQGPSPQNSAKASSRDWFPVSR